ncbi:MAG: PRD domain-containing protein [Lachnospiraceae bacterium]|nr:PRD domain-containing protein [Lachnospiraceae bacterium]
MKVEKIINNNVVSTFDDSGMEVVIMGRGIGFRKKVGDLIDKEKIEKIFKIENEEALSRFEQLLANLPLEHLQVSNDIISYAKRELDVKLNQNVYLTLTDHINFAIERLKNGNIFHNALLMEVKMFYPKEYQVGAFALKLVKAKTGVELPEDEAASVALHIVNAELNTKIRDVWSLTTFIQKVLEIIQKEFDFNKVQDTRRDYLISSLKLLGKRLLLDSNTVEKSDSLVEFVKKEYPDEYRCTVKIATFIQEEYSCSMSEEEKAYLALDLKKITRDLV